MTSQVLIPTNVVLNTMKESSMTDEEGMLISKKLESQQDNKEDVSSIESKNSQEKEKLVLTKEKQPNYSKTDSMKLNQLLQKRLQRQFQRRHSITQSEPIQFNPLIETKMGFINLKETHLNNKRPFRILAIDGGGVKGIIPASILNQLEKEAGKPIHELFDLICGTSTGAILACMLSKPKYKGSKINQFSAKDGIELYLKKCPVIFKSSIYRKISTLAGLRTALYDSTPKAQVFEEFLEDTKLDELLIDLLVPTFDVKEGKPYFFKSSRVRKQNSNSNYKVTDILNATTAAPTYFAPHKVVGYDAPKPHGYRSFVDGAVTANCPALCGLAEAYKNYSADPNRTILVSLGCGESSVGVDHFQIKEWGALNWAIYFPSLMLSSSVNTVDYQLRNLVVPKHYFRIQPTLESKFGEIDNVSKANLNYLLSFGAKLAEDFKSDIKLLADMLKSEEFNSKRN